MGQWGAIVKTSSKWKRNCPRSPPKTSGEQHLLPAPAYCCSQAQARAQCQLQETQKAPLQGLALEQGGAQLPTERQSHDLGLFLAILSKPLASLPEAQQAAGPSFHMPCLPLPGPAWRSHRAQEWQGQSPPAFEGEVPACPAFPGPGPGCWHSSREAWSQAAVTAPPTECSLCTRPWATCFAQVSCHLTPTTPRRARDYWPQFKDKELPFK